MHSSEGPRAIARGALGNLASFDLDGRTLERVALESDALAKRVVRLPTSRGDVGLRLDAGYALRDGDVVFVDADVVVAVEIVPDDVLVCRPASIGEALRLGHALGNRHLPVQFDGAALLARYDRLVEELLRAQGVPFARERRTLATPFRHADAPHAHGAE